MKNALLFKFCLALAIEELKIKLFTEVVWWDLTGVELDIARKFLVKSVR